MRLNYLLADTKLWGGVKVVFQQADILLQRGLDVTVVSKGEHPEWHSGPTPFQQVGEWVEARTADLTIGTYWHTLEASIGSRNRWAHLCQGLEFLHPHLKGQHSRIREAYHLPLPCLAVSPHLVAAVEEQFSRPARRIPQMLEHGFEPYPKDPPTSPYRVGIVGLFEFEAKGVATGLTALGLLQTEGFDFHAVRVSQWPLSDSERSLLEPREYYQNLPPARMPELFRSLDLLLAPSWELEGFGLAAMEAMACGIPVVASDISCYRGYAKGAAPLVSPLDVPGWAAAIRHLLLDHKEWRKRRNLGLSRIEMFRDSGEELEHAIRWAHAKAGDLVSE
jgi:glycosyltransferase involved in cell wall biosynthesis